MTDEKLRTIQLLAVLLEKYSRLAQRSNEGKEIFEKTVLETIIRLNQEIK